ncbi:MAG: cytochrome c maturation protein CcmE [Eubacteriales bacterium]
MNKKGKLAVAVVVIIGAIDLLIASGLNNNTGSYLSIQEALAEQNSSAGKYIQMEGKLAKGSTTWDANSVTLGFGLTDGKNKINITYNGVKPDNFDSGYPIIVEGRFNGTSGFVAENIKVKCPSKYEAEAKKQPKASASKQQ